MKQILLIEDDADVRTAFQALLEREGYPVLTASDGKAGILLLQQNQESVALVITDLCMPGITGLEVIRTLLSRQPETRIIALSAGDWELEDALQAGARFAFRKPFNPELLLEAIRALI